MDTAPLTDVVRSRDGVTARFGATANPWRLEAVLAGERLVGIVHYAGNDFPIVLERAPN